MNWMDIYGVVWHTGKVLTYGAVSENYGAVGPRFNSRQGQGIL